MANHKWGDDVVRQFSAGDLDGVGNLLEEHPEIREHHGLTIHPLVAAFVRQNSGHCYREAHLQIADLFLAENVRKIRAAVTSDHVDTLKELLVEQPDLIHAEFTAGRGIGQAIHHWKSTDMAQALLDHGADIDALNSRGESPLSLQLRFGTVTGVKFLLDHGADPNLGDGGHLPTRDMGTLIELLLAHGWDINRGQLLHDANHGFGSRVQAWLAYGADPNATTSDGKTALHLLAARGVGRDAIQALFAAGADPYARDASGRTPLDHARSASRPAAARELEALMEKQSGS